MNIGEQDTHPAATALPVLLFVAPAQAEVQGPAVMNLAPRLRGDDGSGWQAVYGALDSAVRGGLICAVGGELICLVPGNHV